jgi:hypothetical protein
VLDSLTKVVIEPAKRVIASEMALLATDVADRRPVYEAFVTECGRDDKEMYALCFRRIQGVRTSQATREAWVTSHLPPTSWGQVASLNLPSSLAETKDTTLGPTFSSVYFLPPTTWPTPLPATTLTTSAVRVDEHLAPPLPP